MDLGALWGYDPGIKLLLIQKREAWGLRCIVMSRLQLCNSKRARVQILEFSSFFGKQMLGSLRDAPRLQHPSLFLGIWVQAE